MLGKIKILTISQIFQYVQQEQAVSKPSQKRNGSGYYNLSQGVKCYTQSQYKHFWQRSSRLDINVIAPATELSLAYCETKILRNQAVDKSLLLIQKESYFEVNFKSPERCILAHFLFLIFIEEFLNIHKIERIS